MMNYKLEGRSEYTLLTVSVPAGKKLFVEPSAMATMSPNMKMKALFKGGLGRFLTSESLFQSEFVAEGMTGEVSIAPGPAGDIGHIHLNNETVYLASSCYVAHTEGVNYETKFQNLSLGLLSGAGWFLIKMTGTGDFWFNGYGAIIEVEVGPDRPPLTLDNGHIVAFTEGVQYEVKRMGGYKSLFLSGEGFVCRFSGRGKVYYQTKKPSALIHWADAFRPIKKKYSSQS